MIGTPSLSAITMHSNPSTLENEINRVKKTNLIYAK